MEASDIHRATVSGVPSISTHWFSQVASAGTVETTWTAKVVIGFALGLPFSLFVRVRTVVEEAVAVGIPGVAADVYVVTLDEEVFVFPALSLAWTR